MSIGEEIIEAMVSFSQEKAAVVGSHHKEGYLVTQGMDRVLTELEHTITSNPVVTVKEVLGIIQDMNVDVNKRMDGYSS